MKMRNLVFCLMAAVFALTMTFAAPASAAKGEVRIVYVEWACATSSTHVLKHVLEMAGYDVETLPVAAAAMYQSLATGDADIMTTAWLPVTHADYMKRVGDKVENLGPNLDGPAVLGWVVPSYVTIDSIPDLKGQADKFKGRIIGIDPGAGLMKASEKAIAEYGLEEYELMEGSGATMTAALDNAIKNNEWVVVTGWAPHWKFGRWDLKILDDPKKVLGEVEHVDTIVRKNLKDDMPEVYAIADRFEWTSSDIAQVMDWNSAGNADPDENAKRWIKENPEKVNKWLGK
jgi:glycine betaine/proline transport system substrate-binding protein